MPLFRSYPQHWHKQFCGVVEAWRSALGRNLPSLWRRKFKISQPPFPRKDRDSAAVWVKGCSSVTTQLNCKGLHVHTYTFFFVTWSRGSRVKIVVGKMHSPPSRFQFPLDLLPWPKLRAHWWREMADVRVLWVFWRIKGSRPQVMVCIERTLLT